MNDNWTLKDTMEYVWKYFELHAKQRMAVFNYFVLIAALLTAGIAGSLGRVISFPLLTFALGLSLILTSFVFWKLDQRVRYLLKHAERTLKDLEEHLKSEETNTGVRLALFLDEEESTRKEQKQLKKEHTCKFWRWHLTYYQCFCIVYIVFGLIGILAALYALINMF